MPESAAARLVAQLPGAGVGTMQIMVHRGYAYIGELAAGGGTQIVDVRDPKHPRRVGRLEGYPGAYSPKTQVADDQLIVNYEARTGAAAAVGFAIWDVSRPETPTRVGMLETGGKGPHRMWYISGSYLYASMIPDDFPRRTLVIFDVSDPARPREVTRWRPELTEPDGMSYGLHHPIVIGDIAYMGWWDYGVIIADVTQRDQPRQIGQVGGWAAQGGGHTHTALPLIERNLMVVTEEAGDVDGEESRKFIRIFDIEDLAAPRELAKCPVPAGDYGRNHVRYGPHNVHENRPGSFQSEGTIYATYFGAGLRVYDVSDARRPQERAHFVPEPDTAGYTPINDLFVDAQGLVYLTDRRDGNLYIVELE